MITPVAINRDSSTIRINADPTPKRAHVAGSVWGNFLPPEPLTLICSRARTRSPQALFAVVSSCPSGGIPASYQLTDSVPDVGQNARLRIRLGRDFSPGRQ